MLADGQLLDVSYLKDGDIIQCFVYNKGYNRWFIYLDGVFNKEKKILLLTKSGIFDFNNHGLIDVWFGFNVIDNICNYNHTQKEVELADLLDYLIIENGIYDLDYRVYDSTSVDIGYFKDYPVNVVEIRNSIVTKIVFDRGDTSKGYNQHLLNWLYYLKDKNITIKISE